VRVALGLDIGTTAVKAIALDEEDRDLYTRLAPAFAAGARGARDEALRAEAGDVR
jgi:sugar (pentulose or hexulose) kinase